MTTTAFEQRVAAAAQPDWCSVAEETAFINAIDTASARVHVYSIGTSVESRDIRAVEVYNGESLGDRPVVLVVGLQHGNEGAGREGALQFMRDLALSEDAGISAYLDVAAWVFLPTTNPDRPRIWAGGTYNNANGVNINRVHFSLNQPEAVAIQKAVTTYNPTIVIDAHEARREAQGFEFARSANTEVVNTLTSLGDVLIADYLRPAIAAMGFDHDLFLPVVADRGSLTNSSALRYGVSVLFESRRNTDGPNEATHPRANRAAMQVRCMEVMRDYHIANRVAMQAQRAAAVSAAVSAGIRGGAYDLGNGTTVSPAGYKLTSAQWDAVATVAETFELRSYPRGNDVIVYMGQLARGMIPMIFDPLVTSEEAGTPIGSAERLVELPVPYVKLGAVTHDDAEFILGGSPRTVSFRTWA